MLKEKKNKMIKTESHQVLVKEQSPRRTKTRQPKKQQQKNLKDKDWRKKGSEKKKQPDS